LIALSSKITSSIRPVGKLEVIAGKVVDGPEVQLGAILRKVIANLTVVVTPLVIGFAAQGVPAPVWLGCKVGRRRIGTCLANLSEENLLQDRNPLFGAL